MQVGQWGAAASMASGVRSNEALGADDMLRRPRPSLCDTSIFQLPLCAMAEIYSQEKLVICREAKLRVVRINDVSYAANVSFASLNIMFFEAWE